MIKKYNKFLLPMAFALTNTSLAMAAAHISVPGVRIARGHDVTFQNVTINPLGRNQVITVSRAGTIFLEKHNSQLFAILGRDAHNHAARAPAGQLGHSAWFSGGCDNADANFIRTIIRETEEESAGAVVLDNATVHNIMAAGEFAYSNAKNSFAIFASMDGVGFNEIVTARHNEAMGLRRHARMEVDEYFRLPLSDLREFAAKVARNMPVGNPHDPFYRVQDVDGVEENE